MGKNSIHSNLRPCDVINEIRLTLSIETAKAFLIVEGYDDICFLTKFVENNDVIIKESCQGKKGVMTIVNEFKSHNRSKRVIGSCDRDYDINGILDRIFFYDYCCMEMMIISSNRAFKNFVSEVITRRVELTTCKKDYLLNIVFLSCIRKLNDTNKWGLRFEGLSHLKAYNSSKKDFNVNSYIFQIESLNNGRKIDSIQMSLINLEIQKNTTIEELLLITQGHDFIESMQVLHLKSKSRSRALSNGDLASCLRCSYGFEDFNKSSLYFSIKEYQTENNLNIIK